MNHYDTELPPTWDKGKASYEIQEYIIPKLNINEFILIHALDNTKKTALGRFDGKKIVPLYYKEMNPLSINAKNVGQKFMLETLICHQSRLKQ